MLLQQIRRVTQYQAPWKEQQAGQTGRGGGPHPLGAATGSRAFTEGGQGPLPLRGRSGWGDPHPVGHHSPWEGDYKPRSPGLGLSLRSPHIQFSTGSHGDILEDPSDQVTPGLTPCRRAARRPAPRRPRASEIRISGREPGIGISFFRSPDDPSVGYTPPHF